MYFWSLIELVHGFFLNNHSQKIRKKKRLVWQILPCFFFPVISLPYSQGIPHFMSSSWVMSSKYDVKSTKAKH